MGSGFKSLVEVTNMFTEKTESYLVREYHDLLGKRGRLDGANHSSVFYYSDLDQAIKITDTQYGKKCVVSTLDDVQTDGTSWGLFDKESMILGPSSVFLRKTLGTPEFLGNETVRGIMCNTFMATDGQVKLTYYFTVEGWHGPWTSTKRWPLKVVMEGIKQNHGAPFHQTFDFIEFENTVDELDFSVPTGIGCFGLQISSFQSLPVIESAFSFYAELYEKPREEHIQTIIILERVWYDNDNGLVRLDTFGHGDQYTDIQDFKTGVSYRINRITGGCRMSAIVNSSAETSVGLLGALKEPKEFLGFEGNSTYYIGKKRYRGVNCDVWETIKYSDEENLTVFTFYFTSAKTEIISASGDRNTNIPISLLTTAYDKEGKVMRVLRYNVFDFNQADNRFISDYLNIESCFLNPEEKNYFRITFPSNTDMTALAENQTKLFKRMAILSISNAASASLIRFPFIQLAFKNHKISIIGMILERTPVFSGFLLRQSGVRPTTAMDKIGLEKGPEECAIQCYEKHDIRCLAFAMCGKACYAATSATAVDEGIKLGGRSNCNFYTKAIMDSKMFEEKLKDARRLLTRSIQNGTILVELIDAKGKKVFYKAVGVEFGLEPFDVKSSNIYDIVGTKFSVHSTVIDNSNEEKAKVASFEEYHDLANGEGRLHTFIDGAQETQYYFADIQQVIHIRGKECNVRDIDSKQCDNSSSWGWASPNKRTIIGPTAYLFRSTDFTFTKKVVNLKVRGIPCYRYSLNDTLDSNVRLDYYFSDPTWSKTNGYKTIIPIRVVINGYSDCFGVINKVNLQIDYTFFRPKFLFSILDDFSVPPGLGCEDLKTGISRNRPPIKDQFSFMGEGYYNQSHEYLSFHINTFKSWFDGLNKIGKMENGYLSESRTTVIYDYNAGVNYQFADDGRCSIVPLTATTVKSGIVEEMKNSSEILGLDGEYYYLGNKYLRGMYCDVWESVKRNVTVNGLLWGKVIQTVYYMSENSESIPTSGERNTGVPIRISMTLKEANAEPVYLEYNIFNFDQSENELFLNEMDVQSCFQEKGQTEYFMIHFSSNQQKTEFAQDNKGAFQTYARLVISEVAQVSLLRVKILSVYYGPQNINILGLLMERPRFQDGFYLYSETEYVLEEDTNMPNVNNTPEHCAQACLQADSVLCKSFVLCGKDEAEKECFLSTKDISDDRNNEVTKPGYQNCSLYIRSYADITAFDQPLNIARQALTTSVDNGKLIIALKQGNKSENFVANKIEERLEPFNYHERKGMALILDKFQLKMTSGKTVEIASGVNSVEDCYRRCQTENRLSCASFSYCNQGGRCRLSSTYLNPQNKMNEQTEVATSCAIYIKSALEFFDLQPGLTPLNTVGIRVPADSADECALNCKQYKNVTCLGFLYCPLSKSCSLQKEHMIDLDSLVNSSSACIYYSAKYITEFSEMGSYQLEDSNRVAFAGLSLEQCAKVCIDVSETNCRSISYCKLEREGMGNSCLLHTKSSHDPGAVLRISTGCKYYIRQGISDVLMSSSLISSKSFVGTAFVLLFVGIILGAGGYVAIVRYKNRRKQPKETIVRYIPYK